MQYGKTEADTLRLNGWGKGHILEGQEGSKVDQILITQVGEEKFLCRWKHQGEEAFGDESSHTTLTCRHWKKVGVHATKTVDHTTVEQARALREYAMELEAALDKLARDLDMERAHRQSVEGENQALTAHVARLHSLLDELPDVMPVTSHLPMARIKGDYLERVDTTVRQGPAHSLGIIKALWQAEILDATALKRPPGSVQRAWLMEQAEECRQSAPNH